MAGEPDDDFLLDLDPMDSPLSPTEESPLASDEPTVTTRPEVSPLPRNVRFEGDPARYSCSHCTWELNGPPFPDRCPGCGRRLGDEAPDHQQSRQGAGRREPVSAAFGGRGLRIAMSSVAALLVVALPVVHSRDEAALRRVQTQIGVAEGAKQAAEARGAAQAGEVSQQAGAAQLVADRAAQKAALDTRVGDPEFQKEHALLRQNIPVLEAEVRYLRSVGEDAGARDGEQLLERAQRRLASIEQSVTSGSPPYNSAEGWSLHMSMLDFQKFAAKHGGPYYQGPALPEMSPPGSRR